MPINECPICLYKLAGLPESGRCPECGHEYKADDIILTGITLARRANRMSQLIFMLAIGLILVFRSPSMRGANEVGFCAIGVSTIALAVTLLYKLYQYRDGAIVYLSSQGFGQGPKIQGVNKIRSWSRELDINIKAIHGRWIVAIVENWIASLP
jgi:hypothetical protein